MTCTHGHSNPAWCQECRKGSIRDKILDQVAKETKRCFVIDGQPCWVLSIDINYTRDQVDVTQFGGYQQSHTVPGSMSAHCKMAIEFPDNGVPTWVDITDYFEGFGAVIEGVESASGTTASLIELKIMHPEIFRNWVKDVGYAGVADSMLTS